MCIYYIIYYLIMIDDIFKLRRDIHAIQHQFSVSLLFQISILIYEIVTLYTAYCVRQTLKKTRNIFHSSLPFVCVSPYILYSNNIFEEVEFIILLKNKGILYIVYFFCFWFGFDYIEYKFAVGSIIRFRIVFILKVFIKF